MTPHVHSPHAHAVGLPSGRFLRILLVEDHPDTAAALSRLLTMLGHEVRLADTVASALRAAESSPAFDLLISDIGLPDGSGFDVLRDLQQRGGPIAAIAMTGFGHDQDVAKSRAAGFKEHLTKPVSFERLEALLREITAGTL